MARQVPRYEGVRGRGRASHTVRVNNLTLQRRVGTRKSKRRGGRARRCLDGRWLAVAGHRLRLAQVRHLEAGLVLGQDLHEGPQLQPPLLAGDPVPVEQTEHAAGEARAHGGQTGPGSHRARACRHGSLGTPSRPAPAVLRLLAGRTTAPPPSLRTPRATPTARRRRRARLRLLTRSLSPSSALPRAGTQGFSWKCPARRWTHRSRTFSL